MKINSSTEDQLVVTTGFPLLSFAHLLEQHSSFTFRVECFPFFLHTLNGSESRSSTFTMSIFNGRQAVLEHSDEPWSHTSMSLHKHVWFQSTAVQDIPQVH